MGVIIMFVVSGFYYNLKIIDDLVDFVVVRIFDYFGIE